jgi:uncharacterized protein YjbI with pentapeptide repeats
MKMGLSKYDEITTSDEIDESISSGKRTKTAEKHITTVAHRSGKTFWDLLQLLIVPLILGAALAGVAFKLNESLQASSQRLQQDQFVANRQLQQNQFADAQRVALDQQRQTLLTTYLDRMSGLMPALHASSRRDDPARITAQAQTLAVLLQLNPERKRIVVLFLYQANLINVKRDISEIFRPDPPSTILQLNSVDLSNVDLSGVDLHGISLGNVNLRGTVLSGTLLYESNLYHVNLSKANLKGANLNGSFLDSADLNGANLTNATIQGDLAKADLSGAHLSGANLKGANLSEANLSGVNLSGAIYNTEVVQKEVNGVMYDLQPTQWPQGFDPKAAGAIEDNTPE